MRVMKSALAQPTSPSKRTTYQSSHWFSTVSWALSAAVCNYMSNFSVTFLLALYLQLIIGYTAAACGLILLFQPPFYFIFRPDQILIIRVFDIDDTSVLIFHPGK